MRKSPLSALNAIQAEDDEPLHAECNTPIALISFTVTASRSAVFIHKSHQRFCLNTEILILLDVTVHRLSEPQTAYTSIIQDTNTRISWGASAVNVHVQPASGESYNRLRCVDAIARSPPVGSLSLQKPFPRGSSGLHAQFMEGTSLLSPAASTRILRLQPSNRLIMLTFLGTRVFCCIKACYKMPHGETVCAAGHEDHGGDLNVLAE